jgi:hypothetical protein
MLIVCLIKKYVFTVTALCCPILEDTLFVYAMFGTEPLPEDGAHYNAWTKRMRIVRLSCCYGYLGCHIGRFVRSQFREACLVDSDNRDLQQSTHETRSRVDHMTHIRLIQNKIQIARKIPS